MSQACTLPETRSFHYFQPLSSNINGAKRVSHNEEFSLEFNLTGTVSDDSAHDAKLSNFVACRYDENYWIGLVVEVDTNNKDVLVNFMHPHCPAFSFHWPSSKDICWILNVNIDAIIQPLSTITGQQYNLSHNNSQKVAVLKPGRKQY